MNIGKHLQLLSERSSHGFVECLKKIQAGKNLRRTDTETIFDETNVSGIKTAAVFGISVQGLKRWVNEGCPQSVDKSYSIPAVFKWRIEREESRNQSPVSLKEEKLKKEIEFLQERINEKQDQYIERSLHEQIMVSRAASLRTFLEKTFMANAIYLAGKSVDEIRTLLFQLVTAMMKAYVGNTKDV